MAMVLKALGAAHEPERRIFAKMMDMKMKVSLAKSIMAFFIYLEPLGSKKFIIFLASVEDNNYFSHLFAWVESILSCVLPDSSTFVLYFPTNDAISCLDAAFSLYQMVVCEKGKLHRGVCEVYDGACSVIFEDILEERGLRVKMNPNAKVWVPSVEIEEETRFLFITFSNGRPVPSNQIRFFFTWWFGPYVEKIYVHRRGGGPPLFGKIAFSFSFVPHLILNGRDQVEFLINGRTLRCKKFHRRRTDHKP